MAISLRRSPQYRAKHVILGIFFKSDPEAAGREADDAKDSDGKKIMPYIQHLLMTSGADLRKAK